MVNYHYLCEVQRNTGFMAKQSNLSRIPLRYIQAT